MWIVLALSLALLALAIGVTLSGSPAVVARSNAVEAPVQFETVTGPFGACQGNETLPAGATAIRLSLDSVLGPKIKVRVLQGKRLLTSGERGSGWTAADVTIPVRPVSQTAHSVSVCFEFVARYESVGLTGEQVGARQSSARGQGLVKVEYLEPGERSWWSLARTVASHMTSGRAWPGVWVVPFLAATMGAIVLCVCWLGLRLER
ncbi:MAG TPA: hypothetical protein VK756_01400 [Solirubrobacteraceae bacterium]|nr:hypothetical protein [Solirubrobacteraceae bacterium]